MQEKTGNASALAVPESHMNDLIHMDEAFDAAAQKEELARTIVDEMPAKDVYVNRNRIDRQVYYEYISECVRVTGWNGEIRPFYALAVSQTQIRSIPTLDYIGYSASDTDDEAVLSSLRVNEPFLVKQVAVVNDYLYYWGYSSNVCGWVDAKDIAFCASKEEWLDMWQVDLNGKDFLVVTGKQIFGSVFFDLVAMKKKFSEIHKSDPIVSYLQHLIQKTGRQKKSKGLQNNRYHGRIRI